MLNRTMEHPKVPKCFGQAALKKDCLIHHEVIFIERPSADDHHCDTPCFVMPRLLKRPGNRASSNTHGAAQSVYVPPNRRSNTTTPCGDDKWKETTNVVRLNNLPFSITDEGGMLKSGLLEGVKSRRIRVVTRSRSAYVTLSSHKEAKLLLERLGGMRYDSVVIEAELVPPIPGSDAKKMKGRF